VIAALVAVAGLAAGCSDDSFVTADAARRLEAAGVPRADAECIADTMVDELDDNVLNEERDPTPAEQAEVDRIVAACRGAATSTTTTTSSTIGG
jgi:hypothetical protein